MTSRHLAEVPGGFLAIMLLAIVKDILSMELVVKWWAGGKDEQLWIDFTSLLAEYFSVFKNPLTRYDIAHLSNFWSHVAYAPGTFMVCYLEGESVGCALIEVMKRRETRPYGHEISRVYIKPEFRRLGIGEALMGVCQHRLLDAGYEYAFLLVDKDNLPALSLYRKMGFIEAKEVPVQDNQNVVYLKLPLSPPSAILES